MKAVLQRASRASVSVGGEIVSQFQSDSERACGLLILLGVEAGDGEADSAYLATKATDLRIFDDQSGKMNLALAEVGGQVIVVSQFTLLADWKKGRRPGFQQAAPPAEGERLYLHFCQELRLKNLTVGTGVFGAHMAVSLVNDGPVTILLEARHGKPV